MQSVMTIIYLYIEYFHQAFIFVDMYKLFIAM